MQITVMQENLAKALNYVNKAISSTPSIPILANVLIEASDGRLKLSTTDLELGINFSIGADIKKDGKTTVDAKMFTEFVSSLSSGKLEIHQEEKVLTVDNKQNSADFNVIDADEFPPLPEATGETLFTVDALKFSKALGKTVVSAASDDSRPVLTGLLFESNGKKLSMVGVDGFRLSKKTLEMSKPAKNKLSQIVPAKALTELARIISDQSETEDVVEVYLLSEKNQILFKVNDLFLSSRLIEGEFPDYKQIIPKETKYKFAVDKSEFSKTVKIVSIFARNAIGNKATFEFLPQESLLRLCAQVADVGENESNVEIHDVAGDQLKTAYNTKFLLDMTGTITGDEVCFECNGTTAPGVFKDKDDKDYLHIIMPMRID